MLTMCPRGYARADALAGHPSLSRPPSAAALFKEMIYPCTLKDFHGRHYQEGAVHVKRADPAFWADYFAAADVGELLAAQPASAQDFFRNLARDAVSGAVQAVTRPATTAKPAPSAPYVRAGAQPAFSSAGSARVLS